jgi:hypothetical protein
MMQKMQNAKEKQKKAKTNSQSIPTLKGIHHTQLTPQPLKGGLI